MVAHSGEAMRKRLGSGFWQTVALALGLALAVIAPTAKAAGTAELALRYTTTAPDAPTGLAFHALFGQAGDPSAKPPPLRSAVVEGPGGLSFDTRALTECMASDAELELLGSDACPSSSQLTVGKLTGVTGFGAPIDPLTGDDHVFNGPNQIIEVITAPGTPLSPAYDRLTISGSTLTAHPPIPPGGPPDGKTAIRSIDFQIPARSAGGRSLITTPGTCPAGGQWLTTATFYFDDGSTATVVAATPCSRRRTRRARRVLRGSRRRPG